jgi:hypothetical protein
MIYVISLHLLHRNLTASIENSSADLIQFSRHLLLLNLNSYASTGCQIFTLREPILFL